MVLIIVYVMPRVQLSLTGDEAARGCRRRANGARRGKSPCRCLLSIGAPIKANCHERREGCCQTLAPRWPW